MMDFQRQVHSSSVMTLTYDRGQKTHTYQGQKHWCAHLSDAQLLQ